MKNLPKSVKIVIGVAIVAFVVYAAMYGVPDFGYLNEDVTK